MRLTLFDPPPDPRELPDGFPSPFDELGPHPLARRAAEALQSELRSGLLGTLLDGPDGGKMFGVLVVRDRVGRLGWIRSFSSMIGGRWSLPGFAPPMFDEARRRAVESPGEATVAALTARVEAFRGSPGLVSMRSAAAARTMRHEQERTELRARHEANRRDRRRQRVELTTSGVATAELLHALDQQSRGDKAERRRLEAAHAEELRDGELERLERRLRALERLRRIVCRGLMKRIHDTYPVSNARGETRPLRSLYAPAEPPSGAGDCAGPKLLAAAHREGLQPIALAEFWWGAPPAAGARLAGGFHAACRDKCGPLLPFLLEGLRVTPPRTFAPPASELASLPIVYEDRWIVIVDKPAGLLSVPGRQASLLDSVLTRLRARHPDATGPLLVHRLDLDTSGLLVAALDARTHAALQAQFARRQVRKRYVAWLDGLVPGERGVIELALRGDVHDRPRQIHDPVHGKAAVTAWEVLERRGSRTRIALFPRTGRTHQLRAHAAHPLGLGAPIVGDRLYGREDDRLRLHAERLEFTHPGTGEPIAFESPPPF